MRLSHIVVAAFATVSLLIAEEAAAPAKEKAPKAAAAKVAVKKIAGTLASIDLVGNTIVVNVKKAQETIVVDSTTKVKVSGKKAAFGDLLPDMQVKVQYKEEDGKKLAVEISGKEGILSDADSFDTTALSEMLCRAINNLADYEKDLKNIRNEMARTGYMPRQDQKYKWTRDKMFLKESVASLTKAYSKAAGHKFNRSTCSAEETEP